MSHELVEEPEIAEDAIESQVDFEQPRLQFHRSTTFNEARQSRGSHTTREEIVQFLCSAVCYGVIVGVLWSIEIKSEASENERNWLLKYFVIDLVFRVIQAVF